VGDRFGIGPFLFTRAGQTLQLLDSSRSLRLEARAQLGIAIGEFYPQQQLASAAVTYNRLPISFPFNIVSNTYWQAEFGAQAGWEIDIWGKLRRAIESADAAFLASIANYADVQVTLIGDVASATCSPHDRTADRHRPR
jgi:outer membrane protein TolC